jgi:Spy/CpxP family protein refolding chaperone
MKFTRALKVLTSFLVISLFAAVVLVVAQEQPGNARPGGFDPAQMQARALERSTTNVKLTAEESKVIIPKIEVLINYRFSSMQELQPLRQDLRDLVDSGKATDKTIKLQLDKIKSKAAEIKKKTDDMENGLKAVLTVQQEAQLTLNGVITNGVGGMGFGGGRGGFGGGRGGGGAGGRGQNN